MTDPTPAKPNATGRWKSILLFVSLAGNLLIVGLIAGVVFSGGPGRDGPPPRQPLNGLGFGPYTRALSDADKDAMREALKREEGSFRQNREELRGQFEAFIAALRAQPYDSNALQTLVTDQQQKVFDRQVLGRALLFERIDAMTDEERTAYADRLARHLERGERRPRRDEIGGHDGSSVPGNHAADCAAITRFRPRDFAT